MDEVQPAAAMTGCQVAGQGNMIGAGRDDIDAKARIMRQFQCQRHGVQKMMDLRVEEEADRLPLPVYLVGPGREIDRLLYHAALRV
jgi:hypothetical protein